jgi:hypothetical protein
MTETKPTPSPPKKVEREARLRWVPISKMRVSTLAQRELRQARVDAILANLDLEQIGNPTVNERDGWFYIIDGQHRIEALRQFGLEDSLYQCWTYVGLTEEEEAERFLKLNDVLIVDVFSKFRVGVRAGRETETDINRIVRAQGLCVSRDEIEGAIRAVGTLRRVYLRDGAAALGRTLRIIRDAYGDAGLEAPVIDGIGLLCSRYNGQLVDEKVVTQLSRAHGGVNGLLNQAEELRRTTGNYKSHCVAAAAVKIINRAKGPKLPSWWKSE